MSQGSDLKTKLVDRWRGEMHNTETTMIAFQCLKTSWYSITIILHMYYRYLWWTSWCLIVLLVGKMIILDLVITLDIRLKTHWGDPCAKTLYQLRYQANQPSHQELFTLSLIPQLHNALNGFKKDKHWKMFKSSNQLYMSCSLFSFYL